MVVEAAIGTAVGWLWGELANVAESRDTIKNINDALNKSISESFLKFSEKYPDFFESFFHEAFLKKHVCPEIRKYLTRHEQPDIESVAAAFPDYVVLSSENQHKDEIEEFFDMVMSSMKQHDVLQEIINNRQIDETNQSAKEILDEQKKTKKKLEDIFNKISFQQDRTDQKVEQSLGLQFNKFSALLEARLPTSKGDEFNKFLTKQLDRTREFINTGEINNAQALLESIKEEVYRSDDYTRFRWHTNLGACLLARDEREKSAEQYLTAYNFAQNNEKAVANRVRSYLLLDSLHEGLSESEKAIEKFPNSGIIWALHINAKSLLNINFDSTLLPNEVKDAIPVLLMLSDQSIRKKSYSEAFDLAKSAYEKDTSSSDAKRAMLSSALAWISVDSVKAHYKQLTDPQIQALSYSVTSFGDVIPFLQSTQSKQVFVEVAHNIAVALSVMGDLQLKDDIINYALSIHPNEEPLLWHRIKQLKLAGNIKAIHELTDNKLDIFDKSVLFILAEVSANTGDIEWNDAIREALMRKGLEDWEQKDLLGLEICSIWKSGDNKKAIDIANDKIDTIVSNIPLACFYIRILDSVGMVEKRDNILKSCTKLTSDASSHDTLLVADVLYDFDHYYEAAKAYARLIESPSDDDLTKRYLNSLIKSEQRAIAISVLEKVPENIRNKSVFKRIEANLARASGDLDTLERILTGELHEYPADSYIAAGYIATLYRKKKLGPLKEYLSTTPDFDPIVVENEIEIAKFQMELGFEQQAMLRMYNLFRLHPNSSYVAGFYLLLLLQIKNTSELLEVKTVSPGDSVYLESDEHKKIIVIEPNKLSKHESWPECVKEDSDIALSLIGLGVDDSVNIDVSITPKKWAITKVESMYIFASNRAHKVLKDSVSVAGPVWSINVKKPDGKYDFSPYLESVKSRSLYVNHVFSVYDERKMPLQLLSNALSIDIVTLFLEWPYHKHDLFISTGVHDEREQVKDAITRSDRPYVIDLPCLIELGRLGLLQESLSVLTKPLIPTSLKEVLSGILHVHNKMELAGISSEHNGQLCFQELPREYKAERSRFLNELMEFIDNSCEIVPVVGPSEVSKPLTTIGELIGYSSHDAIYLALERDAILLSEDGGLRSIALNMGVDVCAWLQPFLMILRDRNTITEEKYSKSVLDKLERGHNFTSITANDLLWAAKPYPNTISTHARAAIETFRNPSLDLSSGVVVGSQFLRIAAEHITPDTLFNYYKLINEVLSYGREPYKDVINQSLLTHVEDILHRLNHRKAKLIRRKFRHLLAECGQSSINIKPIIQAVRDALYN